MKRITVGSVALAVSGVAAGLCYLQTLAPSITWAHGSGDSGELVTAAYFLGVAHPTGYPVYMILGWLFTHFPFGSVARNANLLSAVAAVWGVLLLCLLLARSFGAASAFQRWFSASVGALMLAFSPVFWSQAIVSEVYALNALFIIATLLVFEWWLARPHRDLRLGAVALTLGLGLANHVTVGLLLPGLVIRTWFRTRSGLLLTPQALAFAVGGLLLGLSAYLLLPLRAGAAPAFADWGDPRTFQGFWGHVTGAAYREALFSLPPEAVLSKAPAMARFLLEQFGWLGYALAVVGLWRMQERALDFLLLWLTSVLAFSLFALNYPVLDSQVYLLPLYIMVAITLGWGALWVLELCMHVRVLTYAAVGGLMLMIAGSLVTTYPKVDLSNNWEAYSYAVSTLESLPQHAVVVTKDDQHLFSLWYVHYVEGVRRDVAVVDARLLTWPWYQRSLATTYTDLALPDFSQHPLKEFSTLVAENRGRPMYLTFGDGALPTIREGALYRIDAASLSGEKAPS